MASPEPRGWGWQGIGGATTVNWLPAIEPPSDLVTCYRASEFEKLQRREAAIAEGKKPLNSGKG